MALTSTLWSRIVVLDSLGSALAELIVTTRR